MLGGELLVSSKGVEIIKPTNIFLQLAQFAFTLIFAHRFLLDALGTMDLIGVKSIRKQMKFLLPVL